MMPSGTDAHQFKVSTHVCNENALLYSRLYKRVVSDITDIFFFFLCDN